MGWRVKSIQLGRNSLIFRSSGVKGSEVVVFKSGWGIAYANREVLGAVLKERPEKVLSKYSLFGAERLIKANGNLSKSVRRNAVGSLRLMQFLLRLRRQEPPLYVFISKKHGLVGNYIPSQTASFLVLPYMGELYIVGASDGEFKFDRASLGITESILHKIIPLKPSMIHVGKVSIRTGDFSVYLDDGLLVLSDIPVEPEFFHTFKIKGVYIKHGDKIIQHGQSNPLGLEIFRRYIKSILSADLV